MKKLLYFIIPITLFFIGYKVNAYNMKGFNTSNTIVYNIDNNTYTTPSGYMSRIVKARWSVSESETLTNTDYYQATIGTSIKYKGTSQKQLRNCQINVNGAYIDSATSWNTTNNECGSEYCQSSYVITSYFNGQNLQNVPIFIQCDVYTDMEVGAISYTRNLAHEQQSQQSNSDIIQAIANQGSIITNTNNYNANMNNANRDSNTDRIINNQHSIASEVINNGLVCNVQQADLTFKYQDLGIKNVYLNSYGVSQTDSNYNSSDFIEVGSDQTISLYNANQGSASISGDQGIVHIVRYNQSKTRIGDSTIKSINSSQAWQGYWDANTKYIRISIRNNYDIRIVGYLYKCDKGMQKVADEQSKQTGLLGQIKDKINDIYNVINNTISNLVGQINSKLSELVSFFTSTDLDTSRLSTLINRLRDSNPPIFSILTSLKNYVQSFSVSQDNCSPITIPMKDTNGNNRDFQIQCGTTLVWGRQDFTTFRQWWNIFVGGIIIYKVGLMLIKVLNNAFDPTKDELGKGLEV